MTKDKPETETVGETTALDIPSDAVANDDAVLELDGMIDDLPLTLSVDVVSFGKNTFTHLGAAATQEQAIAMTDDYDLKKGEMIRVTPMVYFLIGE